MQEFLLKLAATAASYRVVSPLITLLLSEKFNKAEAQKILLTKNAEAEAEANKMLTLAKAQVQVELMKDEAQQEIQKKALNRLMFQAVEQQVNSEMVVELAASYSEEKVSEEPVDKDWLRRFFNKAQDISDEQMQELWAKILAGEVCNPGSYSRRTLDVLSNLSKKEAEIFVKACFLTFEFYEFDLNNNLEPTEFHCAMMKFDIMGDYELHKYGLTYFELQLLREANLIEASSTSYNLEEGYEFFHLKYDNKLLTMSNSGMQKALSGYTFTQAGHQLYKIVNKAVNKEFLNDFISQHTKSGWTIKLEDFPSISQ